MNLAEDDLNKIEKAFKIAHAAQPTNKYSDLWQAKVLAEIQLSAKAQSELWNKVLWSSGAAATILMALLFSFILSGEVTLQTELLEGFFSESYSSLALHI